MRPQSWEVEPVSKLRGNLIIDTEIINWFLGLKVVEDPFYYSRPVYSMLECLFNHHLRSLGGKCLWGHGSGTPEGIFHRALLMHKKYWPVDWVLLAGLQSLREIKAQSLISYHFLPYFYIEYVYNLVYSL